MSEVSEVDTLHNLCRIIAEGKSQASSGFLMVASALSIVKREKLWIRSYGSFEEFCTDQGLKRSTCYKLAQIWDRFGERAKGVQFDRLAKLLPLKLDNEEEVLEQARELNAGAFQDVVRVLKGQTPSDGDCKHDQGTHSYCSVCRKRVG